MIVRKTNSSVGSHRREGAGSSTGPAPKSHNAIGRHSPSFSEAGDKFGDDLAHQPRVVLIGVTIPGFDGLGTIAMPFLHIPFFHEPLNSQGGQ